jgi:uncharacterized heparinase superfamily protein
MTETSLAVKDVVQGGCHHAEARFHLHPAIVVEQESLNADERTVTLLLPTQQRVSVWIRKGRARLEPSTFHPRFGQTIPNVCLVIELEYALAETRFYWSGR